MRSIVLILIYVLTSFGLYVLFTTMYWILDPKDSLSSLLRNTGWMTFYIVFLSWWVGIFPAREYYSRNEQYFDDNVF
jgi:hypothetical protein